jgi:DNA-binding GntR family transcriptional regulator
MPRSDVHQLIRRTSATEVAEHLRRLIFDGRLQEGERLNPDAIATELGISRLPVREALVALDREGWLRIVPYVGTYVQTLDPVSVGDHFRLLAVIHCLAIRRMADQAAETDYGSLERRIEVLSGTTAADQFARIADEFWVHVFSVGRASRLRSISKGMGTIVPGNAFERIPGLMSHQRTGFESILRHLKAGDEPEAEKACSQMFAGQAAMTTQLLRAGADA